MSNLKQDNTDLTGDGTETLTVTPGGTIALTGTISGADKLAYKIVEEVSGTRRIVGYGIGDDTTLTVNATANVTGGGALSTTGDYTLYVWAQQNNGINSHEGSEPKWFELEVENPTEKTVSVGTQNGTLTEGEAGRVDFTVTTSGIDNGEYSPTLNTALAGVTAGEITIEDNAGTLTVYTTEDTPNGTHPMTVTVDGVTSGSFNLVVQEKTPPVPPGTEPTVSWDGEPGDIALDLGGKTVAYIQVSLGASGSSPDDVLAEQADVTVGGDTDAITAEPASLTEDGNVTITARFEGTATVSISFSGGDVAVEDTQYDKTIAVTVTDSRPQPGTDHTITASAGVGGNISPSGDVTVTDGADQTFYITANSGYYISGVKVDGSNVGVVSSYTFDNVKRDHTIYAEFAQTYTPSPSRDRDSGSNRQDTVRPAVPLTLVVDAAKAKAALAEREKSGADKAKIRYAGEIKVLAEVWPVFGDVPVDFDTLEGGAVQVRITIREPGKMTGDKLLSGYVKGSIVDSRRAFFEKWFQNKVQVIHLDQAGPWGQPVEIAAKVDLTGMDTENLYFYSYDKASNTYKRIEKPAYRIDKNGYLHFTTENAGDIIISDGSLERR